MESDRPLGPLDCLISFPLSTESAPAMNAQAIPYASISDLCERYDTLFIDAFGVLVHSSGALPGAPALVSWLNETGKPYFILTNDASKLPEASAKRYQARGLKITPDIIVTSGSLIKGWFSRNELAGARCIVLGTPDTHQYVIDAGGEVVPPDTRTHVDVIVAGDDDGFDFQPAIDGTLSALLRQVDAGRPPRLLLPNPDLIFPRGEDSYGFTSGAMALILEAALATRYPGQPVPEFEKLGKPHAAIFEEGTRRAGGGRPVMIGDQLGTDIRGALDFGIDSALIGTGISQIKDGSRFEDLKPTWILESLALPSSR